MTAPATSPGPDAQALATAREIAQQPALWRRCASDADARSASTQRFLARAVARDDSRVLLTGAGTSAFIGEVLAPAVGRALGRRVEAIATTDLVSNPRQYLARRVPTLVVSFARSGDSPESVAAVELAARCVDDVHHLVITCNEGGALARHRAGARNTLVVTTPPEAHDAGFAMTSSFTCMLLTALLSLAPGTLRGDAVARLASAGELLLAQVQQDSPALVDRAYERVVYLGSGPLKGLAQESALKMLELTAGRVATWFDSPLGFRHGPKSVVNDRTLVVVLGSSDPYTRLYDRDILAELAAVAGADNLVHVTGDAQEPPDPAGRVWRASGLDDLDDAARAAVLVLPAQVLALGFSLAHGLTPDNPFPDGEVNRVVTGVRIHPLPEVG